eukprot:2845145-Lingulodinium_polyedra.AAC.1
MANHRTNGQQSMLCHTSHWTKLERIDKYLGERALNKRCQTMGVLRRLNSPIAHRNNCQP